VATAAAKVGELVGEIAAAFNEQSQGIDQINKAVSEMDKVVQSTAASAEKSTIQIFSIIPIVVSIFP
jgi:methyl-accepting chemotaxis protein